MKENLDISGKKLEIMNERQIGVALDNFMLKDQRHSIDKNFKETFRRHNKRLIKREIGKDKYE